MRSSNCVRWLAGLGLSGIAIFTVAMVALHAFQPELSPLDEAMSYYVHGRHGWLTTLGLVALGVGSLALTIALVVHGLQSFWGILLLATWSIGALLGGIFSADPPGNWEQPPTISGALHGIAAMIALAAFPPAAVFLVLSLRRDRDWRSIHGTLTALTVAVVLTYIAFMASLVPVFVRPGPPVLLGLTERVLLFAYIAWLAVVAIGLFRTGDPKSDL